MTLNKLKLHMGIIYKLRKVIYEKTDIISNILNKINSIYYKVRHIKSQYFNSTNFDFSYYNKRYFP